MAQVLDTSALMAFVQGEAGDDVVRQVLRDARAAGNEVLLPFMALMELEYLLRRGMAADDVDYWLDAIQDLPVRVIESATPWRRAAAAVKSQAKLSLADAWMAALALMNDAELVHKDPEFDSVAGLKHIRLPYDTKTAKGRGA